MNGNSAYTLLLGELEELGLSQGSGAGNRVTALNGELIAQNVVEVVGAPAFVSEDDLGDYSDYGIEEAGWYVFARVSASGDNAVGDDFEITGAAGYKTPETGDDHVDVAVKFAVASVSKVVTINWGDATEKLIFRATDLAIRNLDYRATFYMYDLSPYVTWSYTAATGTFASGKNYYTKNENDEYELAEVTVGATIPANTYYIHSGATIQGFVQNVSYALDLIDCPITLHLPEVLDENYGAWFEIQTTLDAARSITLVAPTGVHISKALSVSPAAGVNVINAQYHGGSNMWRILVTKWDAPAGV